MLEKLKALCLKYKELLLYLIFGVLTTVVNWVIYFPLVNLFSVHYQLANVIGWVAAVLFAFVTNKVFVFEKKDFSPAKVGKELLSFTLSRVVSLLSEMAVMFLFVDLIPLGENIAKVIAAVLVVVLNYVFSKLFVFADRR